MEVMIEENEMFNDFDKELMMERDRQEMIEKDLEYFYQNVLKFIKKEEKEQHMTQAFKKLTEVKEKKEKINKYLENKRKK